MDFNIAQKVVQYSLMAQGIETKLHPLGLLHKKILIKIINAKYNEQGKSEYKEINIMLRKENKIVGSKFHFKINGGDYTSLAELIRECL